MALEEQMREEMARLADSVRSDPASSYGEVLRTARRRQRRRRIVGSSLAAVVLVAVGVGVSQIDVGNQGRPPITRHVTPTDALPSDPGRAGASTLLDGEWLTEPVAASVVRNAAVQAGLSRAAINGVLGSATQWRVDMTFNQLRHGTVVFRTDDPTSPGSVHTSATYGFALLGHDRLRLRPPGSETAITLVYSLRGDVVTLRLGAGTLARLGPRTAAWAISWTATSFARL